MQINRGTADEHFKTTQKPNFLIYPHLAIKLIIGARCWKFRHKFENILPFNMPREKKEKRKKKLWVSITQIVNYAGKYTGFCIPPMRSTAEDLKLFPLSSKKTTLNLLIFLNRITKRVRKGKSRKGPSHTTSFIIGRNGKETTKRSIIMHYSLKNQQLSLVITSLD